MARYKGTFASAANYEPLIAAPFDARQLVETKADLINPSTWQRADGSVWTYTGMMVSVANDIATENNGIYVLIDEDYTQESNWRKTSDARDIANLQAQIDNIEVAAGGVSIEVETEADLPRIGDSEATYYIKETSGIKRWDEKTGEYISYGGTGVIPDLNINVIHGGNANGTD